MCIHCFACFVKDFAAFVWWLSIWLVGYILCDFDTYLVLIFTRTGNYWVSEKDTFYWEFLLCKCESNWDNYSSVTLVLFFGLNVRCRNGWATVAPLLSYGWNVLYRWRVHRDENPHWGTRKRGFSFIPSISISKWTYLTSLCQLLTLFIFIENLMQYLFIQLFSPKNSILPTTISYTCRTYHIHVWNNSLSHS